MALKTDGTLWMWGKGENGQLGQGNTDNHSSPVQVGALTTWSGIAAGGWWTAALKTDGTIWAWGEGASGQLGQGNTTDYSSPVQVGALTTWSKIAAGNGYEEGTVLAIKTDGTLWAWGEGSAGQLGDGTTVDKSSPVQVGALTTWAQCSPGYKQSQALKTDGTLWAWGSGANGTLGQGNTTNYSSPVQVGSLTTWSKLAAGTDGPQRLVITS
jgi:alpha-tubulin suppressor-like RCC1 family protein